MGHWSRGAKVAVVFLVWCVLCSVVGTWGWKYGYDHGPLPDDCGCGSPAFIPIVIGWGLIGALAGVAVVSAVMGAAGLALFIRARQGGGDLDPEEATAGKPALDDWLSEVATK